MLKNLTLIMSFCFLNIILIGQSLETHNLGTAGQSLSTTTGGLTYNIGEVVVFNHNNLNAGLIQFIDLSTLTEETAYSASIALRPNPCYDKLTVDHDLKSLNAWIISDQSGRIIHRYAFVDSSFTINTENLLPGQYFLIPVQNNHPLSAISFIKINH